MDIELKKATIEDCSQLHDFQIRAFESLLDKYQDYEHSPGAVTLEHIVRCFYESTTDYYFIYLKRTPIGGIRVCNHGQHCQLKQISILPEYQNCGYAQVAIKQMEACYPNARKWSLDTILQEKKLCYLYEKLGYKKTGKLLNIQQGMDLVFYEK